MNKSILFVLLAATCLLTSCGVYQPLIADIPLISKKNDLRVDASLTLLPSINSTVSYGLSDKVAIQAYVKDLGPIYYFQGAAGYYKDLGNKCIMEFYTGFGYGHGSSYNDANPGDLTGNYQSYFEQFNIGVSNIGKIHTDYGISLKIGLLHSNLYDSNFYVPSNHYDFQSTSTFYSDNSLLLEPTCFVRFGGDKLKFNIKLGYCWINKFTNKDKYFPYDNLNIGIGLNYRL